MPKRREAYKIKVDFPVPENGKSSGRPRKYPRIEQMNVGDSFFVSCDELNIGHTQRSILGTFRRKRCKADLSTEITTRRMPGGIRVWRVK